MSFSPNGSASVPSYKITPSFIEFPANPANRFRPRKSFSVRVAEA